MKNEISRRDFIKTSAAVAGAGGLLSLPACGEDGIQFAIPMGVMNSLGSMTFASTRAEYNSSTNDTHTAWVKTSGERIRDVVKDTEGRRVNGFAWEFELFKDNTINAWCMPGARIAFYDGIIPLCQNPAGVAIVMGHEIAHAVCNHGGQRMAQRLAVQLGVTTLSAMLDRLADPDDSVKNIALQVFGVTAALGGELAVLAYSRKHEREADKLGLIYAAKAGYDPNEAPGFWERMSKLGGGGPEFLSTHPTSTSRAKALREAIPEAEKYKPAGGWTNGGH